MRRKARLVPPPGTELSAAQKSLSGIYLRKGREITVGTAQDILNYFDRYPARSMVLNEGWD
jgi:hypothetical protein